MALFKNKYRIESNRCPNWDYSSPGYYFITICTKNRECILGKINKFQVILSEIGKIVEEEWLKSFEIRKELECDLYVIMPNHIHAIVGIIEQTPAINDEIDVIKNLVNKDHPNTVYGVGTVQEEVGLRGARTSAWAIQPDIGIALEVGIASDVPGGKKEESMQKLGKGPALLLYDSSMIPHIKLRDLIIDIAKEKDIPLQLDMMERGGTDAGTIHINMRGVPSVVIGVPCRYIHSHSGIINRDDYDNTVRLITEIVKKLDAETVAKLVSD